MQTTTLKSIKRNLDVQQMYIDQDFIVFLGPMGRVPSRCVGATALYSSPLNKFGFWSERQGWHRRQAALVPPLAPHGFSSRQRALCALMIEPEKADWRALDENHHDLLIELNALFHEAEAGPLTATLLQQAAKKINTILESDPRQRPIDPRILTVVHRIQSNPTAHFLAEEQAASIGLSFSRFLHLFKLEIGMTFRAYIAWKRARKVLSQLGGTPNLTGIALDVGYPDSSHFSRCVKNVYGLQPRDMFRRCQAANVTVSESLFSRQ